MELNKLWPPAELAVAILEARGQPLEYQDLIGEILRVKELPSEGKFMTGIYTEINLDHRLAYLGAGLWGLRDWAPRSGMKGIPLAAYFRGRKADRARPDEAEEGRSDEIDDLRHEEDEDEWEREEGE